MEALREKLASQPPFMISIIPAALAHKSAGEIASTIAQFTGIPAAKLAEAGILLAGKSTDEIAAMIKSVMDGDDSLASALPQPDDEVAPEPTAFDIFPVDRSRWVDASTNQMDKVMCEIEEFVTLWFSKDKGCSYKSCGTVSDDLVQVVKSQWKSENEQIRFIGKGNKYVIWERNIPHAYMLIITTHESELIEYTYCVHKTQGAFPIEEKAQYRTEAHLKMLPLLKAAAKIE